MKAKIFKIITYTMLTYSLVTSIYLALPADIQSMIPYVNQGIGIYSAVITAIGGSGGLAVQAYITKAQTQADTEKQVITDKLVQLINLSNEKYDNVEAKYETLNAVVTELIKLVKIDLKSKLSNPMIELTARQEIEGALYGDKEE